LTRHTFLGELALDGRVRAVRGVLPMALQARQQGQVGLMVPAANASEAALVGDLQVIPVAHLHEALAYLRGAAPPLPSRPTPAVQDARAPSAPDLADVCGQGLVKRALEVAAAGGHNLLMIGPPGAGKTMLAKRLPGLLPPLTADEALETMAIRSVVGGLMDPAGLAIQRPFRAPHHTVSDAGLCGGGSPPRPGEISLAHHGLLFLDELPEFKRSVLEVLRQPLEAGYIDLCRARSSVRYPARFMLVASMNPCPCGHLNDPARPCVCTPAQVQRYLHRISGPLLDRIDLHVEVTPVPFAALQHPQPAETSATVRARVEQARLRQLNRYRTEPGLYCNAQMTPALVRRHARPDDAGHQLLARAMEALGLSARALNRILKVARTLADLDGHEAICAAHVSEAVQYRSLDRAAWAG
ncbi:MAG: YifB family Mg chelatase-like AAA ATPase, partial [Bacteroidota bacterium]